MYSQPGCTANHGSGDMDSAAAFVLIWALGGTPNFSGVATHSQEFTSEDKCRKAKNFVLALQKSTINGGLKVQADCFPK